MKSNPILSCDFYKVSHPFQYPKGTEFIYSNFTPRSSHLATKLQEVFDDKVIFFGLQGFIKEFLIDGFNEGFFNRPKAEVVAEYKRRCDSSLGEGSVSTEHIEALHDLGYLPLYIKAIAEGSAVNMRVPVLTIKNTHPDFFWLTNFIETLMSAELWQATTSATTAVQYKRLLTKYAEETGAPVEGTLWQGHDFSMRGMSGIHAAAVSGAGHLLSFLGTDTIPALDYLEQYYGGKNTFVGGSVPATEHSVMCAGGKEDEKETFKRLITETYPSGIVSIVSDTWDFWNVLTNTAMELKEEILARKTNALGLAKVVFRPDSGDPADILCGDALAPQDSPAYKGAVECLWEVFGGTTNNKGYKSIHERIGLIYGDSITLERAKDILQRLKDKGFASNNVVFGIGSYTYQYNTRDSYGFAMKATHSIVNGVSHNLFKDPVTDSGVKKSAKGLLRVEKEGDNYVLYDEQTPEQENRGELKRVFLNGHLLIETNLEEIRSRVK